jgi:hypothetical protein
VFVATAGDKVASRVALLAALYTHTGRKGEREREREKATQKLSCHDCRQFGSWGRTAN